MEFIETGKSVDELECHNFLGEKEGSIIRFSSYEKDDGWWNLEIWISIENRIIFVRDEEIFADQEKLFARVDEIWQAWIDFWKLNQRKQ